MHGDYRKNRLRLLGVLREHAVATAVAAVTAVAAAARAAARAATASAHRHSTRPSCTRTAGL